MGAINPETPGVKRTYYGMGGKRASQRPITSKRAHRAPEGKRSYEEMSSPSPGTLSGREVSDASPQLKGIRDRLRKASQALRNDPTNEGARTEIFAILRILRPTQLSLEQKLEGASSAKKVKRESTSKEVALCIRSCCSALDALVGKGQGSSEEDLQKMGDIIHRTMSELKARCDEDEIRRHWTSKFQGSDPLAVHSEAIEEAMLEARRRTREGNRSIALQRFQNLVDKKEILSEDDLTTILGFLLPVDREAVLQQLPVANRSLNVLENRRLIQQKLPCFTDPKFRYSLTMETWEAYVRANVQVQQDVVADVDALLAYAIRNQQLNEYLHKKSSKTPVEDFLHDLSFYTSQAQNMESILRKATFIQNMPEIQALRSQIRTFLEATTAFEEKVLHTLVEQRKAGSLPPEMNELVQRLAVDAVHVRSEVLFHPDRIRALESLLTHCEHLPQFQQYIDQIKQYTEVQGRMKAAWAAAQNSTGPQDQKLTLREIYLLTHYSEMHAILQYLPASSDPNVSTLRAQIEQARACIDCIDDLVELPTYFPGDVVLTNARFENATRGRQHIERFSEVVAALWKDRNVPHYVVNAGYNHAAPVISDAIVHPDALSEGPCPATLDMNFSGLSVGQTSISDFVVEEAFRPVLRKILLPETLEKLKLLWNTTDENVIEQKLQDIYRQCVANGAKALLSRASRFVETTQIMNRTYVDHWVDWGLRTMRYTINTLTGRPKTSQRFQPISLPSEVGEATEAFTCSRNTATLISLAEESLNTEISRLFGQEGMWISPSFPQEYPLRSVMPVNILQCTAGRYEKVQAPWGVRCFVRFE